MYFKPRIFISSTFEILNIRSKIKNFFDSVGIETLLYEKNLTPSINPATYRQDLLDADFVIFIFNEQYGTITNSGKSGTHEEWDIANKMNLPKHVYVKKSTTKKNIDPKLTKFISENLISNYISYYFYTDVNDLLRQMKNKTFTVAKEILLFKINKLEIEDSSIQKLAVNHDISIALKFIRGMEELFHYQSLQAIDLEKTTVVSDYFEHWAWYRQWSRNLFIDSKLNELFDTMLTKSNIFRTYHSRTHTFQSSSRSDHEIYLKSVNIEILYFDLFSHQNVDYDKLRKLIKELLSAYIKS